MSNIKIGEREYEVTPLKLKHLRRISKEIEESNATPRKPSFDELYKWIPYVYHSIAAVDKNIKIEDLDEMTIDEFSAAWDAILKISGFKIVAKEAKGEAKPTGALTTSGSSVDSPPAISGPTTTSVN